MLGREVEDDAVARVAEKRGARFHRFEYAAAAFDTEVAGEADGLGDEAHDRLGAKVGGVPERGSSASRCAGSRSARSRQRRRRRCTSERPTRSLADVRAGVGLENDRRSDGQLLRRLVLTHQCLKLRPLALGQDNGDRGKERHGVGSKRLMHTAFSNVGGADQGCEGSLRPPSFKGGLRCWWRALGWPTP